MAEEAEGALEMYCQAVLEAVQEHFNRTAVACNRTCCTHRKCIARDMSPVSQEVEVALDMYCLAVEGRVEVHSALVAVAVQVHSREWPAGESSFASSSLPCQLLQLYRVLQDSILAGTIWTAVGICCSVWRDALLG